MNTHRFNFANCFMLGIVIIIALICFLPLLLMIIVSFTDETAIAINGFSFFPKAMSLSAYQKIIYKGSPIIVSYAISIFITVVGTFVAVSITYFAAYGLANPHVKYRNGISIYFFIPMVFSAGLVPWYLVNRMMGINNTIFALIVPSLMFSPFNLFLTRNFIEGLPLSLMESAKLDGASDPTIALRIYLPLSTPVIAVIVQFYALGYWNDWFNAVMLLDRQDIQPLQYLLYKLQSDIKMLSKLTTGIAVTPPKESFKMATACLTIGPIIFLFPFLQRYFVTGLVVGAIKG